MSQVPGNLKYVDTHEWLRLENDGSVTIGITDHAQALLGDIVFVELPKPGMVLQAGAVAGVVESVKAASDVYMPISGEIAAVNVDLENAPETINSDAYEAGWFFKIRPSNPDELAKALDAAAYAALLD